MQSIGLITSSTPFLLIAASRAMRLIGFLYAMVLGLILVSCGSVGETVEANQTMHSKAQVIWRHHEEAILRALGPPPQESTLLAGFAEAVDFFERLTGIISDTGTYFGRLPTQDSKGLLDSGVHGMRRTPIGCTGMKRANL
jgi:hypothetical protein